MAPSFAENTTARPGFLEGDFVGSGVSAGAQLAW